MIKTALFFLFVFLSSVYAENVSIGAEKQQNHLLKKKKRKLDCLSDEFRGKARAMVKTSVVDAPTEEFDQLDALLQSLVNDTEMVAKCKVTRLDDTERLPEEKRKVFLKTAFIYALKREPDNDYHIIIGDGKGNYFNIENSGLPDVNSTSYALLLQARQEFEAHFGEVCSSKYTKYDKPIAVQVEGSLFFDIDHRAGAVGPAGMRPKTAWEIHPVTKVLFPE